VSGVDTNEIRLVSDGVSYPIASLL